MKKFLIILFSLIFVAGAGFAGWYFFLREAPLLVEFYGDNELMEFLSGDGDYKKNDIVTLTAEERIGYEFESWIKDGTPISSSRIYTFVMSEKTSGKYTAVYRAKEFTISAQNNDVYNIANTATTDQEVEVNINLPKGYCIDELYYVVEGTEEKVVIKNNRFKMPPNHISIFINLKEIEYTITYNLFGGSFESDPITTFTINTPTFNLSVPTREGFDFVGYMKKEDIEPRITYPVNQGTTGNISVDACWDPSYYNVTTHVVGEGEVFSPGAVQQSYSVTLSATPDDGWEFVEVYYIKSSDTEKITIEDYSFVMPMSDIDLYYVFEKIPYTITASENIMYGTIEFTQNVSYVGDTITIITKPEAGFASSSYYYTIEGSDEEISLDGNTFIMPAGNIEVFVEFSAINYNIIYVLNGGELPADAVTIYQVFDYVQLPIPQKAGKIFAGWYDNAEFTGDPITAFSGSEIGGKTFYANYSAEYYEITFVDYDGSVVLRAPYQYGDMPSYTGQPLTRPSTPDLEYIYRLVSNDSCSYNINNLHCSIYSKPKKIQHHKRFKYNKRHNRMRRGVCSQRDSFCFCYSR